MGKVKIKRKSTLIDMTAMSDVTVLLLTFFMLTSTFLAKEPVTVITPSSVQEKQDSSPFIISFFRYKIARLSSFHFILTIMLRFTSQKKHLKRIREERSKRIKEESMNSMNDQDDAIDPDDDIQTCNQNLKKKPSSVHCAFAT